MFLFWPSGRKLRRDSALLGRWGQKVSEKYLKKKGHKLITRNFLCRTGELDLVTVCPDGAVVFVEVKTRADENYTAAENAITFGKKQRLVKTARYFVRNYELEGMPLRFDVVIVVLDDENKGVVRHYENAFTP